MSTNTHLILSVNYLNIISPGRSLKTPKTYKNCRKQQKTMENIAETVLKTI